MDVTFIFHNSPFQIWLISITFISIFVIDIIVYACIAYLVNNFLLNFILLIDIFDKSCLLLNTIVWLIFCNIKLINSYSLKTKWFSIFGNFPLTFHICLYELMFFLNLRYCKNVPVSVRQRSARIVENVCVASIEEDPN